MNKQTLMTALLAALDNQQPQPARRVRRTKQLDPYEIEVERMELKKVNREMRQERISV